MQVRAISSGSYIGSREPGEVFECPDEVVYNRRGEPARWLSRPDGSPIPKIAAEKGAKLDADRRAREEARRAEASGRATEAKAQSAAAEGVPVSSLPGPHDFAEAEPAARESGGKRK